MLSIRDKKMLSPDLVEEIRQRFLYVDWEPYTGERVYLEASGGSLHLKSGTETMAKRAGQSGTRYQAICKGERFLSDLFL
ncbi:MAG TPA: hypothetical protein VMW89_18760 [Desulfatiglandales bacterium]|nr:hypothetical protein [Desulfatiglandales bacterium]